MGRPLREGWAWSAPPPYAAGQRRGRHLLSAVGFAALAGVVLLAPVTGAERVALVVVIAGFGVLSGVLRNRHATHGGRLAVQGAVGALFGVCLLVIAPTLGPVAVAMVMLAVVRVTAMRGPGAGLPVLAGASALMVVVALLHDLPADTVAFAALVGPLVGLAAIAAVAEAMADHSRLADGLNRIDHALVAFAEASVDCDRNEAVRRALDVMVPNLGVRSVTVVFDAQDQTDEAATFAALSEAPVVRLLGSGDGRDVAVGLPMRIGGTVVGVVSVHLATAPRAEDLQLLDVLTDRLTSTLTAEAALERERAARLRLEEAELLRDQIMARVTHDLRAPLSSISGSVFTLNEYGDQLPPEMVHQLYDVLQRNADRVTVWVESLLEHAVHGEEVELVPERVDVGELLAAGVEAAAQTVAGFEVRCIPVPGTAVVDVTAVTRVLVNLLSNATKYAPRGSTIEVRAERESDVLTIVVADTGTGVKLEDQPYLFEPFFRSARQPAEVHGTGLGLATVRDLVTTWGGEVGHRPTRGGGATFWFTVPEAATAADTGSVTNLDGSRDDTVVAFDRVARQRDAERR